MSEHNVECRRSAGTLGTVGKCSEMQHMTWFLFSLLCPFLVRPTYLSEAVADNYSFPLRTH